MVRSIMGNEKNKLIKIINVFIMFLFAWILLNSFWYPSNVYYQQKPIISFCIGLLVIQIWVYLYKAINKKKNISKKEEIIIGIIYILIVSILQGIIINQFCTNPSWDYGVVFENAQKFALEGTRNNAGYLEYFQLFPNNIFLFILLVIAIKTGAIFHLTPLKSAIIMNIGFIDIALLILYVTTKKINGTKMAVFSLILSLFFVPIFLYTPIFYTDTFSLFIPPLFIYLFKEEKEENRHKVKQYIQFFLIGILCFLAKEIKVTSLIIFIALEIKYIFKHSWKKNFVNLIIIIVVFGGLEFIYTKKIVLNEVFHFQVTDYGSFPYSHWIMMGTEDLDEDNSRRNTIGGYNEKDYNYTKSFSTGEEAIKYNLLEYKKRVQKYGTVNYFNYLTKKAVNAWADGLYFADIALSLKPMNSNTFLRTKLLYNERNKYILIYFSQGIQFSVLICIILTAYQELKKKKPNINEKTLACFGLAIFLMFWENRSRYLLNYSLIFIMIIAETISFVYEKKFVIEELSVKRSS